jgi:hypothetical protein
MAAIRLPAAPDLGSAAPKTRSPTRAWTMAPRHIRHGSRVAPGLFRQPVVSDRSAARRARISAWAVGSPRRRGEFRPGPEAAPRR